MNVPRNIGTLHPLQIKNTAIQICGYSHIKAENCVCFLAQGTHFQEYGIIENSLLLACTSEPVQDGNLVIVFDQDKPKVCLYQKNIPETSSEIPMIHNKNNIYAKVLGSFNLYD